MSEEAVKRRWVVRLVIEANDPEITRDRDPYYDDHEMPLQLIEWWTSAMEDRDDSPHIVWSEFTRRDEFGNGDETRRFIREEDVLK